MQYSLKELNLESHDIDCQCDLQATKPVRVAIDNKWDTAVCYIRKLFVESRSKAIFNSLTGANLEVYLQGKW